MGFSTQKEKVAYRLNSVNIALVRLLTYSLKILNMKKPWNNQLLTSILCTKTMEGIGIILDFIAKVITDDPTRIHTLRKYVGQAEAAESAPVRATQ